MFRTLSVAIALFFMTTTFALRSNAAEGDEYLQMLQSPTFKDRVDALKIIERSAVDNDALFQFIEQNLLTKYNQNDDDRNHIDEMAWHCKALASSGDERYLATLEKVGETTDNGKLEKYCRRSVAQFDNYIEKRSILNKPPIAGYSEEMSKNIHMLKSGDYRLMRNAAQRILKSSDVDERVYDMIRDILVDQVEKVDGTSLSSTHKVDTLNYMVKCLGASGKSKYIYDLKFIKQRATSYKTINYAGEAIATLQTQNNS